MQLDYLASFAVTKNKLAISFGWLNEDGRSDN